MASKQVGKQVTKLVTINRYDRVYASEVSYYRGIGEYVGDGGYTAAWRLEATDEAGNLIIAFTSKRVPELEQQRMATVTGVPVARTYRSTVWVNGVLDAQERPAIELMRLRITQAVAA